MATASALQRIGVATGRAAVRHGTPPWCPGARPCDTAHHRGARARGRATRHTTVVPGHAAVATRRTPVATGHTAVVPGHAAVATRRTTVAHVAPARRSNTFAVGTDPHARAHRPFARAHRRGTSANRCGLESEW